MNPVEVIHLSIEIPGHHRMSGKSLPSCFARSLRSTGDKVLLAINKLGGDIGA
jgi:hypothetical protein